MPIDFSIPLNTRPATFDPIGTMGRMADLRASRQNEEIRDVELRRQRKAASEEEAYSQAMREAQGDPSQALRWLKDNEWYDAADKLETSIRAKRGEAIQAAEAELSIAQKSWGTVLNHLRSAKDDEGYQAVLPTIRGMVEKINPEYVPVIPDRFDPEFVKSAEDWGKSSDEMARSRAAAFNLARAALEQSQESLKHHQLFNQTATQYLATVDSPEEWDSTLDRLQALGASDATLAPFRADGFSPQRVQQLRAQIEAGQKQPNPGSLAHYIEAYASEKGVTPQQLNKATVGKLVQEYHSLERAPQTSGGSASVGTMEDYISRRAAEEKVPLRNITGSQILEWGREFASKGLSADARGVATRWKVEQLNRISAEAANLPGTPEEREAYKKEASARIDEAYGKMIGEADRPAPSPVGPGAMAGTPFSQRGAPPAGARPPALQGSMGDFFMPQRPPMSPGFGGPVQPPPMAPPRPPVSAQMPPPRPPVVPPPGPPPTAPPPVAPPVAPQAQAQPPAPVAVASAPPVYRARLESAVIPKGADGVRLTFNDGSTWEKLKNGTVRQIKAPGRK